MSYKTNGKLTWTILSISLLTVMAGAAIAPALGIIREHFSEASDLALQLVISLPALFIILANLFFSKLCSLTDSRTLALAGLALYCVSGAGCFFADNIVILLILRAVLGLSVGIVMPLSTGLLAYYYPPEEQAGLMGLSAAMNQMGGVVATFLAGILAQTGWNWSFLVYLLGLIAMVLVALYLPAEHLKGGEMPSLRLLRKYHPSVTGMFLVMVLFFIYPTRFAICARSASQLSDSATTLIMVGLDLVAFLAGLVFGKLMHGYGRGLRFLSPACFIAGYLCLSSGTALLFLLFGSAFIGIAVGIGVPYMNTVASMQAGKNAASTVMPLLSSALYLGQFLSPLIVTPLSTLIFDQNCVTAPYRIGVIIGLVYLLQAAICGREKQ